MKLNNERLLAELRQLGQIGFREGVGTSRVAYSPEFYQGRDYVCKLMEDAGLEVRIDGVGNLIGAIPGKSAKRIAIGSHIDSVPGGGIYDGCYGVLAGLEVLRTLKESGYENLHSLEVIAFNEEEGNAVGGTFGSKALAGVEQEASALEKCASFGIGAADIASCKQEPSDYMAYLEWHIEQGGTLENAGIQLGIVEGIVAIVRYMVRVKGCANHAGSTPMHLRDDALEKASRVICRALDISRATDPDMTCTVGYMNVSPGAVNVIPGEVSFPIEYRAMNTQSILRAVELLKESFPEDSVEMEQFLWQGETRMDSMLMESIEKVCIREGFTYRKMPSGAGHDAINMALFCPTAMLFIPSVGGISHSIHEYSTEKDLANGTEALLRLILDLDKVG